jgi:integrase
MALDDLTSAVADRFKADLMQSGLAPATVVQVLGLVRKIINHATRQSLWCGQNSFSKACGFTLPKVQNKGERWLSEAEAVQLLDALELRSQQTHDMARLSLLYGLRATELVNLQAQDIDWQGEVLHVMAKGRRQRALIDCAGLEMLRRYQHRTPGEYVFQARGGGRINDGISASFGRAVASLGLNDGIAGKSQKVWFHTLRHTWASWLAQSGRVSLHELMELGRWENYEMVLRYAHLIPDNRRQHLSIASDRLRRDL